MAVNYYLQYTTVTGLSPLYDISGASFNVTGPNGASDGKVEFNPLTFTVGTGALSQALDQIEAAGTPIKQVDLITRESDGTSGQVLTDSFALADVRSDGVTVDQGTTTHSFDLDFGALQETYVCQNADGDLSQPLSTSWNRATNSDQFPGSAAPVADGQTLDTPLGSTSSSDPSSPQSTFVQFRNAQGIPLPNEVGSP